MCGSCRGEEDIAGVRMAAFARQARTKGCLQFCELPRPFSNFQFVEREFDGLVSLRRIFSQVRQLGGRTLVLEQIDSKDAEDIREENEDLTIRCPTFSKSATYRLSFFTKRITSTGDLLTATDEDFLGYALVKRDDLPDGQGFNGTRIYESVIHSSHRSNNYIRSARTWACLVADTQFRVKGLLYAQQNSATNVCAHAALRTAVSHFHPNGDMTYREMNKVAGIDHKKRIIGGNSGDGLTQQEMQAVLEAANAVCLLVDYEQEYPSHFAPPPPEAYLYGNIEAGYPAIVCFATSKRSGGKPDPSAPRHAITVFGHTFNEDTWVSRAEQFYYHSANAGFIPSRNWLSTFIAHDDNFGSNYCIPRNFLYVRRICTRSKKKPEPCRSEADRVVHVLCPMPRDVLTAPNEAELIGIDYLGKMLSSDMLRREGRWMGRLYDHIQRSQIVLRPVLLESITQYQEHLKRISDWEHRVIHRYLIDALESLIPSGKDRLGKVWMLELSIPELFSANKRKLGELILRADIETVVRRDFKNFVLARFPTDFLFFSGGSPSKPEYTPLESGTESHTELFGCED